MTSSENNPQDPFLLTDQPLCVKKSIDALNEIILSDNLQLDEKQIIKIIRFRQYLSELNKITE